MCHLIYPVICMEYCQTFLQLRLGLSNREWFGCVFYYSCIYFCFVRLGLRHVVNLWDQIHGFRAMVIRKIMGKKEFSLVDRRGYHGCSVHCHVQSLSNHTCFWSVCIFCNKFCIFLVNYNSVSSFMYIAVWYVYCLISLQTANLS